VELPLLGKHMHSPHYKRNLYQMCKRLCRIVSGFDGQKRNFVRGSQGYFVPLKLNAIKPGCKIHLVFICTTFSQ
jgi:hypothetical protein